MDETIEALYRAELARDLYKLNFSYGPMYEGLNEDVHVARRAYDRAHRGHSGYAFVAPERR